MTPDGVPGPKTARAIAEVLGIPLDPVTPPPPHGTLDARSEENIATLLPKAQKAARRFMSAASAAMEPHGVTVKIISGTRTYAEQNALYAKGRTQPGPIVTNARGGYSNHNFGVAFDLGLFRNGDYLEESPHYKTLGKIGRDQGLEWGGDWTSFVDTPHYQLKTGLTLAEMRAKHDAGEPVIV